MTIDVTNHDLIDAIMLIQITNTIVEEPTVYNTTEVILNLNSIPCSDN